MALKTGLGKLDSLFKKGIPEKSSILLLGPPKSGKTLFGLHFLFEGLRSDEYGIYIVTNSFPEDVVTRLEKFGKVEQILKNSLLKFVDCYSVHAGVQKENTTFIIRVSGPSALTEIGMAFSEVIKQIPKNSSIRLVFDSVSTLLLFNNPHTVENFVQNINGKMKAAGATSIFIVEEGMHDEKDVTTLDSILDVFIHMKKSDKGHVMEIDGFGVEKTLNYSIVDDKLKMS